MREILFRGRRIDNGEWVEGYYAKAKHIISEKEVHVIFHTDLTLFPHSEFSSYEEVIPETIGQYTGLKDKNGRRIFEGDVVEYIRRKYHVDMAEERCGWWPFACGDGCGCCEIDTISPSECVVIGNIHDNPELLEEENQ